jgi:hypothetical protein
VHPTEQVPSLVVSNEKLKDPKGMASAFNSFFLTITEKLNVQKFEKGDVISFLKDSFPGNFPSIRIIPITEAEIKSIIHSLKPKNSLGYDKMNSKNLKNLCFCYESPIKLHL